MNQNKQKGITLIALVITIIVLLILAGVSIAMLTGSNGVLTKATQAQVDNARGEASDKINTALNGVYAILLSDDYTGASTTFVADNIITGNGLDKDEYAVSVSNAGADGTKVVSIYWIPGGATLSGAEVTPKDDNVAKRYKGYIGGNIEILKASSATAEGKYKINSASISPKEGEGDISKTKPLTLPGTEHALGGGTAASPSGGD